MKNFYVALSIALTLTTNQVLAANKGMPQLNPEFWYAQIFWLLLIFVSLYLIIWKVFLPKITNVIENRKLRVVNDLNEAQKIKESAEKKLKEYIKIIENSKNEAKKIIKNSKKKLETDIDNKKQKFNEEIEKELSAVEEEIKNLKNSSIVNINKIAIEISSEVIKQVLGTEVNRSNVSAIVEDVSKRKVEKYS